MSNDPLDPEVIKRAFPPASEPPKDAAELADRVSEATLGPETLDECPVCHGSGMLSPGRADEIRHKLALDEPDTGVGFTLDDK